MGIPHGLSPPQHPAEIIEVDLPYPISNAVPAVREFRFTVPSESERTAYHIRRYTAIRRRLVHIEYSRPIRFRRPLLPEFDLKFPRRLRFGRISANPAPTRCRHRLKNSRGPLHFGDFKELGCLLGCQSTDCLTSVSKRADRLSGNDSRFTFPDRVPCLR